MKKITLYAVRHGQTLFNLLKRTQGWCDSPLTETGILQAKCVSAGMEHIPFTKAFSSPSERAMDTANLILGDRDIPLVLLKNLKEMNFGTLEGQDESDNFTGKYTPEEIQQKRIEAGGETPQQVADRVVLALNEIYERCEDGDVVLVGTHGLYLSYMLSYAYKMEPFAFMKEMHEKHIPIMENCVIHQFSYDGETFEVTDLANVEYRNKGAAKLGVTL